jgi:trk system potassium uptake protein TrkA
MAENQRFVLIGLGAYGKEIARTLHEHNADVIIMDRDPNTVNMMKSEGFKFAVQIDNLDPSSLAKFVDPEDIVIVSMGDAFESNILTIAILKEIGVKTIYSRATKDIQVKILEKMDITEILFPEKHEGRSFALKLLNKDIKFIDEFAPDVYLIEVPVPEKFIGKTIIDMEIRTRFKVNVIGLKLLSKDNAGHEIQKMDYVGFERTSLKKEHSLLVIGKENNLKDLIKKNGKG